MAQKVLVVIPTAGSADDVERIKMSIDKMGASLHYIGLEPVFHIAHVSGIKAKLQRALLGVNENVTFYRRSGKGFGEAIIAAINDGVSRHSPDFVMTGFADYLNESSYAGNLVKPLLYREADFTTGAWQDRRATALEVPLPQYLNETRVSAAVTYANPSFKPSKTSLAPHAAVNEAVQSGKGLQTFAGFLAFRAEHWPKLQRELNSTLRGARKHVHGWGIEPALLLSALNSGLRVANAPFKRGYEHKFPVDREKFIAGRLMQFDDGMAVVRHFLQSTRQKEKLKHFDAALPIEREKIQRSPLRISRHAKAVEKFGVAPRFLYRESER